MREREGAGLLERAHGAAARHAWPEAFELFMEADGEGLLSPGDLPVAGDVAYAAGALDVTIAMWERAHARFLEAGDDVAAGGAAARVAMHLLFDTALMAPVRGWSARAARLLDGHPDSPAHAWLAVVRAYERMLSGDLPAARQWAWRAVEVGAQCDAAACAIGRVAAARLLILDGDIQAGLAQLEDAGVAAVSSELDPLSTGVIYCELVCALQGLAQYDLAEQWTEAMERWGATNAIGSIHGRCRVHRAEILRLRGAYAAAEHEALAACDELRPYLRRELGWPLTELGRIRLRMGDVEGAERALLAAHRVAWDPEPVLALVHLARGDVVTAAASIRDALARPAPVPSKELPPHTELRRAPLLEAQVEIALAAGDTDRARSASAELTDIAARFESKALRAAATLAQGSVRAADGAADDAAVHFSEAARLWNEIGAPYETARARTGLADALRGREQHAKLEHQAVGALLEGIEPAAPAMDHPNVFRREGDYWAVAFAARTVHLRDVKGMRYLARLLGDPGREFHVLDLVATEAGAGGRGHAGADRTVTGFDDAGEMLDARAKEAYRRRLAEIDADLDEADANGDAGRAVQAAAERDFLVRELSRAVGLGGRDRRAGSASERARAAVTRAIRQTMVRIGAHHPELGAHLDLAIRTGTYCAYLPDPRAPIRWSR